MLSVYDSKNKIRYTNTHDPSCTLAVCELLGIRPLEEEIIRSVELRREAPLAEPQWAITERGVGLHTLQVYT